MKRVWRQKRAKEKRIFRNTREDLWDGWQTRQENREQTLEQFYDMALRFVGPEIMLNMLRKMVHEFIDGKDFKV